MSKAVGGLALSLLAGVGSLALAGSLWGSYAECASLVIVGLTLIGSGQALPLRRASGAAQLKPAQSSRAA